MKNLNIPFVSYDKGNISFLKGGLIAQNNSEMINNIELLITYHYESTEEYEVLKSFE